MTKIYVTKYALSSGIEVFDLPETAFGLGDRIYYSDIAGITGRLHAYGKGDWYRTAEDALADAESRRLKMIESLKRRIAKLENMTFEVKS